MTFLTAGPRYNLEQICAVTYLANYGMQIAIGNNLANSPWGAAGEPARDAYRHGVLYAITHQPVPAEQHAEWVRYHTARRTQHPNLVPWDDLPVNERDKDAVFLAVVNQLAGGAPPAGGGR